MAPVPSEPKSQFQAALAGHEPNALLCGQFESFNEAMFLPCSSRHAAQPWNPAAECKINGQSKPARPHSRSTGGFRRDGGRGGGASARAAPAFPRLVKAGCEEGNLWLRGRRLIRFESASANLGAEGWAAPAEHIWNNPPAPPGERFHSGHAATLQLTLVKTAYKQDHASSSLLVWEANGGCRYRCRSAWKNPVRSACIMGDSFLFFYFFTSPACKNTFRSQPL